MLRGHSAVFQALLGTLFTWGLTAAGAALVFIFSSGQRRILDGSLGFAAGVMLAASYWSLLAPAVEMATSSGGFGAFAFFPVAVGFTLGAAFVYLADVLMPQLGAAEDPHTALALNLDPAWMKKSDAESPRLLLPASELSIRIGGAGLLPGKLPAADPGLSQAGQTGAWGQEDGGKGQGLGPTPPHDSPHHAQGRTGIGPGLPVSLILQTTCLLHGRSPCLLVVFPVGTADKDPSGGTGLVWVRACGHLSLCLPLSDGP
ncbi:zinc transporter ZIP11 isoform X2 [Myotis daubentonii]|nr:zinc transporter ZIP11 isoform X2 [Myotis daubentonii]